MTGRLLLLLCVLAIEAPAANDSLHAVLRRHFEWGEYDSIVRKFPRMADSGAEDSALSLNDRLLLGVACFETGKTEEARRRFTGVLQRDIAIELDNRYVSANALEFFASIKQAALRDAQERQLRLSQEVPSFSEFILKKRLNTKTKHRYALLFFGGAAVFGGAAALSQLWYNSADRGYQKPNLSPGEYDKYASARNTSLTIRNSALAAAAVLTVVSIYFYF
jgi:hypothetical protein